MKKVIKLVLQVVYLLFISYILSKYNFKTTSLKKINRFLTDLKHILLWTGIYGFNYDGQNIFMARKCKFINCYLTMDKNLFGDTRYFDVILFNGQDISIESITLPNVRSLNQRYIFVARDSSDRFPVCNPIYDDFFNWTWTYRSDSTITYRFLSIHNRQDEELGTHINWIKNMTPIDNNIRTQLSAKNSAAAIFLDGCKKNNKRAQLVGKLQEKLVIYNMSLEIFGECGKKCKRKSMAPCFWRLSRSYYFYLAFEDSTAYDYITDIVLYAYSHNTVPIVYGGADYDRFLPPESYIIATDNNLDTVALKMYEIISDKQRYYDFFRWRNHYVIRPGRVLDPCALCTALNNPSWLFYKTTYKEFRRWWNKDFRNQCGSEKNIF